MIQSENSDALPIGSEQGQNASGTVSDVDVWLTPSDSPDVLGSHNFKCPTCDEEGIITLPNYFMTFPCPAECGATFAKYEDLAGWAIKCVVQPVFAKE